MTGHKIERFFVDCNPICGGFLGSEPTVKKEVSGDSPNTAKPLDLEAIAREIKYIFFA
jgi:hypothetical protein